MASGNRDKIENHKAQTRAKIEQLLDEFSRGKINRDQFNAVYAHQTTKLKIAEIALRMNNPALLESAEGQTLAIRQAHMGKAVGMMIYHNKSGLYLDTIGVFDVPQEIVTPVLNEFSRLMEADRLIERRIEHAGDKQWLLFAAGTHTSVIVLFQNEPSLAQSREIERLHHDFEIANQGQLSSSHVDASKLAYPFLVFVRQKMTKDKKA